MAGESWEQWAIIGGTGSGKSTLLEAIAGRLICMKGEIFISQNYKSSIALETFQDSEIRYDQFYYQQCYNSSDADGTFSVEDYFKHQIAEKAVAFINRFGLEPLLKKEFIKLSNSENRTVLIVKSLLQKPKLLLLDNPYTGLDQDSRMELNRFIDSLIDDGVQVIIATVHEKALPSKITHYLKLQNAKSSSDGWFDFSFCKPTIHNFDIAVKFSNVTVKYDSITVLDQIDLTIHRNDKWSLRGPNGAGKTMLCSLIYADNPQAYANHILLFDQKRGQGESIWDIKERIGFISPELQFYFDKEQTCEQAAMGGLKENPYKPYISNQKDHDRMVLLFHYFEIMDIKGRMMYELSAGTQRLVLFIRTILKNPSLLLLDEPYLNFDTKLIEKANQLLNDFSTERTLLFISHHQEQMPTCVTRFAQLNNGKLQVLN